MLYYDNINKMMCISEAENTWKIDVRISCPARLIGPYKKSTTLKTEKRN